MFETFRFRGRELGCNRARFLLAAIVLAVAVWPVSAVASNAPDPYPDALARHLLNNPSAAVAESYPDALARHLLNNPSAAVAESYPDALVRSLNATEGSKQARLAVPAVLPSGDGFAWTELGAGIVLGVALSLVLLGGWRLARGRVAIPRS